MRKRDRSDVIHDCLAVAWFLSCAWALGMWIWFVMSLGERDGKIVWVGIWENLK